MIARAETVSTCLLRRSTNSIPVANPLVGSVNTRRTIASVRSSNRPVSIAANSGWGTRLALGGM
jgi:hypothetical protein